MQVIFVSLFAMNLTFHKYQGAGNDFVFIDNRKAIFPKNNNELISHLCDRNFGIGADGIILIENDTNTDFKMVYFNPDASETMCGNGARCAVAFAKKLNMIDRHTSFVAFDGVHHAQINNDHSISLAMNDVNAIEMKENYVFTNTGTPQHVELVDNLNDFPVFETGRRIRYDLYGKEGSNVNFVEQLDTNTFRVRTYERGVENETLACGTGVTAVAIAMHKTQNTEHSSINLLAEGGNLKVSFKEVEGNYKDVVLTGPADFVFEGSIEI